MPCGVISVAGTEEFLQTTDVTWLLHSKKGEGKSADIGAYLSRMFEICSLSWFRVEAHKEECVKDNILLFYFMHPGTLNQSLFILWKFVDILASFLNPVLSRFPPIFCWKLKTRTKPKNSVFFILWGTWEFVLLYCLVHSKFWCSKGKVRYYWIFYFCGMRVIIPGYKLIKTEVCNPHRFFPFIIFLSKMHQKTKFTAFFLMTAWLSINHASNLILIHEDTT